MNLELLGHLSRGLLLGGSQVGALSLCLSDHSTSWGVKGRNSLHVVGTTMGPRSAVREPAHSPSAASSGGNLRGRRPPPRARRSPGRGPPGRRPAPLSAGTFPGPACNGLLPHGGVCCLRPPVPLPLGLGWMGGALCWALLGPGRPKLPRPGPELGDGRGARRPLRPREPGDAAPGQRLDGALESRLPAGKPMEGCPLPSRCACLRRRLGRYAPLRAER
jgi:hypothetical protein